jgi:replication factor C subunit 3/5
MFLVDKYYNDTNYIICHSSILRKLINSFDTQQQTYQNILKLLNKKQQCINTKNTYQKAKSRMLLNNLPKGTIVNKPGEKVKTFSSARLEETQKVSSNEPYQATLNKLPCNTIQCNDYTRYSNFQHLIVYGPDGCSKDYLINKLLEKIFGKNSVELKDVEYTVCGYSNTKTKIMIKQSKHHIIIEPNSNGFDKYLIQEIIQDYAKSELLNILKNRKLFKVVIINKIDNLSYYAQASLRRTMEIYSNSCKFILISDQLSKIIEPLRSRCLLVRVPLPSREQILNTLLYICNKENITIDFNNLYTIIQNSDNKMSHAILLLELYNNNIKYGSDWEIVIELIINNIINANIGNIKKLYKIIKLIREQFYILFITNISTQLILRKIMLKLISKTNNLQLKYNIINITSIFEQRLSQGTRHNIHSEAYIIRLIHLFSNYHTNNMNNMNNISDYNDVLEI